jgi:hypothetical protein
VPLLLHCPIDPLPPPRKPKAEPSEPEKQYVGALYNFEAQAHDDLDFQAGDRIKIFKDVEHRRLMNETTEWTAGSIPRCVLLPPFDAVCLFDGVFAPLGRSLCTGHLGMLFCVLIERTGQGNWYGHTCIYLPTTCPKGVHHDGSVLTYVLPVHMYYLVFFPQLLLVS